MPLIFVTFRLHRFRLFQETLETKLFQIDQNMYCLQWLIPVLLLPKPVRILNKRDWLKWFWLIHVTGKPCPAVQPRNVCHALPGRLLPGEKALHHLLLGVYCGDDTDLLLGKWLMYSLEFMLSGGLWLPLRARSCLIQITLDIFKSTPYLQRNIFLSENTRLCLVFLCFHLFVEISHSSLFSSSSSSKT